MTFKCSSLKIDTLERKNSPLRELDPKPMEGFLHQHGFSKVPNLSDCRVCLAIKLLVHINAYLHEAKK